MLKPPVIAAIVMGVLAVIFVITGAVLVGVNRELDRHREYRLAVEAYLESGSSRMLMLESSATAVGSSVAIAPTPQLMPIEKKVGIYGGGGLSENIRNVKSAMMNGTVKFTQVPGVGPDGEPRTADLQLSLTFRWKGNGMAGPVSEAKHFSIGSLAQRVAHVISCNTTACPECKVERDGGKLDNITGGYYGPPDEGVPPACRKEKYRRTGPQYVCNCSFIRYATDLCLIAERSDKNQLPRAHSAVAPSWTPDVKVRSCEYPNAAVPRPEFDYWGALKKAQWLARGVTVSIRAPDDPFVMAQEIAKGGYIYTDSDGVALMLPLLLYGMIIGLGLCCACCSGGVLLCHFCCCKSRRQAPEESASEVVGGVPVSVPAGGALQPVVGVPCDHPSGKHAV